MNNTNSVDASIQAVSPEFRVGVTWARAKEGATSPASNLFNLPSQATGSWTSSNGLYIGTAASSATPAVSLIGTTVHPGALLELTTTLKTSAQGGVVFDYQGPSYYKFVTLSKDSNQLLIGHRVGNTTVIDRSYAMTVSATTNYNLGVTVRGGLVNASINGAVVASVVFNETSTMGGYGFISVQGTSSGQTSFDIVRLRTDDVAYAPPPLMAASAAPAAVPDGVKLSSAADVGLQAVVTEAKRRWLETGLVNAQTLDAIQVTVANLNQNAQTALLLGETQGNLITLDDDAAGWRWFEDSTPRDNEEYRVAGESLIAKAGTSAAGHMDLLTVVEHEIGHVLGYPHSPVNNHTELMDETLAAGIRLSPSAPQSDTAEVHYFDADLGRFVQRSPKSDGAMPVPGNTLSIKGGRLRADAAEVHYFDADLGRFIQRSPKRVDRILDEAEPAWPEPGRLSGLIDWHRRAGQGSALDRQPA